MTDRSVRQARRGHLFVIDGDLNKIKCDAVLVPTDRGLTNSTSTWDPLIRSTGVRKPQPPEDSQWKVVREPSPQPGRPTVWFGNVGEISSSTRPYVAVAAEFIRQSYEFLGYRAVPPRVALNVLGSGRGGMGGNKGKLIQGLVRRLLHLVDEYPVDIVLVTWGVKQYAAAQRARQSELRRRAIADKGAYVDNDQLSVAEVEALVSSPTPGRLASAINRLAQVSRTDRLVLFVGAGVSSAAGLPTWQELIDGIAGEVLQKPNEPTLDLARLHELDVRDQAQVLARRLGTEVYRERLEARLQSERYSVAHGLLASMDSHEVVTTNYDNLLEAAYGSARPPAVLPFKPVGPSGRWILKLHGTIDEMSSVVLTREDYLGLPERSQALFGIVQAMLMTKHMLFVGYSLSDDSFHRIVHDVRRARQGAKPVHESKKIGTVLTLFDDPLLRELWGDDLDVVGVAEQLPPHLTTDEMKPYIEEASRYMDIVLDLIAVRAADVTPFLLDPTYKAMLIRGENRLKSSLVRLEETLNDAGLVGSQIREMLKTVLEDDPKDVS